MRCRSETLAHVPLFAALGSEDVCALDSCCIWRRAHAGDWLLDDYAGGTDVYFVVNGHVRGISQSPGRQLILADIRDGEYFGMISAIDGKPGMCRVRAITNTVIARMKASVFREAIDRYPEVRAGVLGSLAQAIRTFANRTIEHAHLHVRERLCTELLRLSRANGAGRFVVSPPPTHAELAARINARREAVTKLLKGLELEGAIVRTRSTIALVDPDRLRHIIAGPAQRAAA
jgi:CRP/FNR family transcriptional regulator, cyclic AMP receptor protein